MALTEALAGRLLVASPSLEDPNFTRTVILMLASTYEGALGIILNRPSPADVDEILPQWRPYAASPTRVFRGGPVSINAAICLAEPVEGQPPGDLSEAPGIEATVAGLVSVDLAREPSSVSSVIASLRVFSGYAGWGAGQLEAEMEEGGWIVTDPHPGDLLTDDPEGLWGRVLGRMGWLRATYAKAPPSLSLN